MDRAAARTKTGRTGSARGRKRAEHGLQLGYSTNVHPGQNLKQVYRFLEDYTVPIRKRVFGARSRSGLELRFGIAAARELMKPAQLERFADFLDRAGLDLFSINAFPLKNFQARRVKTEVYRPDWLDSERVLWTQRICEVFADLIPESRPGSVSTLGGTYRFWTDAKRSRDTMARNYLDVLATLETIASERGKEVVLAAEPEPDTTFETADELVRFVEDHLLPMAFVRWKKRYRSRAAIEEAVRRRFTVNLDTCHFSVVFESPTDAFVAFDRAGIRVGKVHVTNALRLPNPYSSPRGYETFRGMHEPRYLHQFAGRDAAGEVIWRGKDLDELPRRLEAGTHPDVNELRTHFHVPLYLKRWKSLRTTQEETEAALAHCLKRRACDHLVLETYTWPVLTDETRIVTGIAREYRWLLDAIARQSG